LPTPFLGLGSGTFAILGEQTVEFLGAYGARALSRFFIEKPEANVREALLRPRKDHRGVNLIPDALPFGRLWYCDPDDAIGSAKFYSRSHDAVIRVYDEARNVIKTHEHVGEFKELWFFTRITPHFSLKPISNVSAFYLAITKRASGLDGIIP
jgi:hypothetical protein